MSDGFAIAASGLTAASVRAATAASNLVNQNTEGYQPQEAVATSKASGGVGMTVRPADPGYLLSGQGSAGSDVVGNIVELNAAERAYGASASLIRTQDDMTREMIDLIG